MRNTIRFRSPLFNISVPRDYFINPCCYGDDLAAWLAEGLRAKGYQVEGPDQEDWGWYVEVGGHVPQCLNVAFVEGDGVWQVLLEPRSTLMNIFRKRPADDPKLANDLDDIVRGARENVVDEWLHVDKRGIETDRALHPT